MVDLFEPDDRPAVSELVDALASRRLAGGAVSARLAGGAGATVSLERTGEASVLAGLVAWSSAVVPSPTRPPRPHVLLVEDHPVNRVVAGATLTKLGCHVDTAVNGEDAVARVETAPGAYDLILMDCQMPVLDGYEATRRIRARERGAARVPIVAVTAHAMPGDRERCLDAGMDDYVTKPLRPGDLARLVRTWTAPGGRHPRPAPAPVGDTADLDAAGLVERLGGDQELLAEIVGLLRATTPDLLQQIDDGLARGDLSGVREAAHALVGAIGNFCAPAAEAAARAMLTAARTGDAPAAGRARDTFAAAWQRLEPRLAELVPAPRG